MLTILLVLALTQVVAADSAGKCFGNCLTCYSGVMRWVCTSCVEGYFLRRMGQYYECVPCNDGCVSCVYTGRCVECHPGRHGQGCEHFCGDGCVNNTCDKKTGSCQCKEHFSGETCVKCTPGRYGTNCSLLCDEGCLNNTCDKSTGECICKNGFTGLTCSNKCPSDCTSCESDQLCRECKPGYYGPSCQWSCPTQCMNGICSKGLGYCHNLACKPGYTGARCDHCIAKGKYGDDCALDCMQNCLRCSSGSSCDECKDGLWGPNCTNKCPRICKGPTCDKHDGSCSQSSLCRKIFSKWWCSCITSVS